MVADSCALPWPIMKSFIVVALMSLPLHAQTVVFPLHMGDRWQYYFLPAPPNAEYPGPSARIIGDTSMPGNKRFAVMQWDHNGTSTELLRQSGDSVFLYDRQLNQEILFYDFSRHPKDTVNTVPRGSDTMDIVFTAMFDGPPRTWLFSVHPYRHVFDVGYTNIVQDSLGLTGKRPSFGDEMYLSGAIIDGRVYGIISGIELSAAQVPRGIVLEQNYPNPFNPSTTIRYELPSRVHVTLTVFNTLGQQLTTLVNESEDAGYHEVRFDGSGLASGVYFYRLQAEDYVATKKLVLLK
jgi:hypothetical protein